MAKLKHYNFVAKHAYKFNKHIVFRDRTKYNRKDKRREGYD